MYFSGITAVRFKEAVIFEADDGDSFPQRGFTIVVGCNAPDMRGAFELICNVVEKEARTVSDSFELEQVEIQHIDKDDWDDDVLEQVEDFDREVYYVSGRVYFTDQDLEDDE